MAFATCAAILAAFIAVPYPKPVSWSAFLIIGILTITPPIIYMFARYQSKNNIAINHFSMFTVLWAAMFSYNSFPESIKYIVTLLLAPVILAKLYRDRLPFGNAMILLGMTGSYLGYLYKRADIGMASFTIAFVVACIDYLISKHRERKLRQSRID
jgi:flagellar biosynthesis protein FlhB